MNYHTKIFLCLEDGNAADGDDNDGDIGDFGDDKEADDYQLLYTRFVLIIPIHVISAEHLLPFRYWAYSNKTDNQDMQDFHFQGTYNLRICYPYEQ